MPNHVTTVCTVTGPDEDLRIFVERHLVEREEFSFETIIPKPEILNGTISPAREPHSDHTRRAIAETGYPSWYEWSVANWGTKWDAYEYDLRSYEFSKCVFKFETAWSFPEPVFRKLAEMYPKLVFAVLSFDEGDNFACDGEFNGADNYRCSVELATDEMYKRVYGRKRYEDDEDEEDES